MSGHTEWIGAKKLPRRLVIDAIDEACIKILGEMHINSASTETVFPDHYSGMPLSHQLRRLAAFTVLANRGLVGNYGGSAWMITPEGNAFLQSIEGAAP